MSSLRAAWCVGCARTPHIRPTVSWGGFAIPSLMCCWLVGRAANYFVGSATATLDLCHDPASFTIGLAMTKPAHLSWSKKVSMDETYTVGVPGLSVNLDDIAKVRRSSISCAAHTGVLCHCASPPPHALLSNPGWACRGPSAWR